VLAARGAQGAGHDFAKAKSLLAHAAWIEAEIPQGLRMQDRGIEAESPVCGVSPQMR
jgi:hypothetical protein